MADVTAQLIWYRVKENYESLAEGYRRFSWRTVDILDLLFLGWLVAAVVVVTLVSVCLRLFGRPKGLRRRRGRDGGPGRSLDGPRSLENSGGGFRGGETAEWVDSVVGWFGENYGRRQELIEAWLRTLTEEANQHSEGPIQIKFEELQSGNSLPQFSNISTDVRDKLTLTILLNLTCTDITLVVSIVTKTATNMQTTGCQVRISRLYGPLKIQWKSEENPEHLLLSFCSAPEINLQVLPNSYTNDVDPSFVESVIQKTFGKVVLHLPFPSCRVPEETFSRRVLSTESPKCTSFHRQMLSDAPKKSYGEVIQQDPSTFDTMSGGVTRNQKMSAAFIQSLPETHFSSTSNGQAQQNLRLLVKLVKASGLMGKDFMSCDPYCTVSTVEPPQKHSTSVIKNTVNPFFDEYFLLNTNSSTQQIKFEVYDQSKANGDNLIGQASVSMEDLRRMPSSRRIIPLTGRPRESTTGSGSVTVEFLFMDSSDSSSDKMAALEQNPSIRRIELNRPLMPDGTTVTTKTTTAKRLQDDQLKYNESSEKVEKTETMSKDADDSLSHLSGTSSHGDHIVTNGLDSVTETALRQLSRNPSVNSQSASIVNTGMQKNSPVPILKVTKPPDMKQNTDSLRQSAVEHQPVEVKKKSIASTLKKRFSRNKKSRSQSVDRAQMLHDESHSRHPKQDDTMFTDHSEFPEGTLRKSRSQSFSSSFRNLFRRKKKSDLSRESSMSKISPRGAETSLENSLAHPSPLLPQTKDSTRRSIPVPELSSTTGHPHGTL